MWPGSHEIQTDSNFPHILPNHRQVFEDVWAYLPDDNNPFTKHVSPCIGSNNIMNQKMVLPPRTYAVSATYHVAI